MRKVYKRDRLAGWLCNRILGTLATPWYRDMIGGSIRYGLRAAARDSAAAPATEKDGGGDG